MSWLDRVSENVGYYNERVSYWQDRLTEARALLLVAETKAKDLSRLRERLESLKAIPDTDGDFEAAYKTCSDRYWASDPAGKAVHDEFEERYLAEQITFDAAWRAEKEEAHLSGTLSPREFYEKYGHDESHAPNCATRTAYLAAYPTLYDELIEQAREMIQPYHDRMSRITRLEVKISTRERRLWSAQRRLRKAEKSLFYLSRIPLVADREAADVAGRQGRAKFLESQGRYNRGAGIWLWKQWRLRFPELMDRDRICLPIREWSSQEEYLSAIKEFVARKSAERARKADACAREADAMAGERLIDLPKHLHDEVVAAHDRDEDAVWDPGHGRDSVRVYRSWLDATPEERASLLLDPRPVVVSAKPDPFGDEIKAVIAKALSTHAIKNGRMTL